MNMDWTVFGRKTLSCAARAILAASIGFSAATVASAEGSQAGADTPAVAIEDASGGVRINLSGKLRMLSQRIPASACYLQAGISREESTAMLVAAQQEFALITAALRDGNPDLDINSAETRRKTLVGLERLNGLWEPVNAGADMIAAGDGTPDTVQQLAEETAPLLEMAKRMVTEISQQYANPGDLLLRDALAIDIAGRQRMLAQRVSKNVCLLSTGLATDTTIAELETAASTFDASLGALRNGMPAAGVQPPPTDQIATGLDHVIADWAIVQPIVERALAGQQLDPAELATMFTMSNQLTGGMNAVVGLYSGTSQRDS